MKFRVKKSVRFRQQPVLLAPFYILIQKKLIYTRIYTKVHTHMPTYT